MKRPLCCLLASALAFFSPLEALANTVAASVNVGNAGAGMPVVLALPGQTLGSGASLQLGQTLPVGRSLPGVTNLSVTPTLQQSQASVSSLKQEAAQTRPAAAAATQVRPGAASPLLIKPSLQQHAAVATAAEEGNQKKQEASLTRQESAAEALPKLLTYAGDGVKQEAGKDFDGSGSRETLPVVAPRTTLPSENLLQAPASGAEQAGRDVPAPKQGMHWAPKTALMALAFLALDWGSKLLFYSAGLPIIFHFLEPGRLAIMAAAIPVNLGAAVYYLWVAHSKQAPLQRISELRRKHPVLGNLVYGVLQVLNFPVGVNEKRYAGDLKARYPVVSKTLRWLGIGLAAVLAGTLGNSLEGILNGKVLDFIPFGHGRANIADMLVVFGVPFVWMARDFLGAARKAVETRTPAAMKPWKYFLLPVLGLVAFVYTTSAGYAEVPVVGWYILLFSALFSVGTLAANMLVTPLLEEFNRMFRLSDSAGVREGPAGRALGRGYRLRRALAAGLASLAAFVPFVKAPSAPRMADSDRQALVERYRRARPKLVLMDWDNTFMDNWTRRNQPATEERLALLAALQSAGIRAGFVTNRPLYGRGFGMRDLLTDRMRPEQRKGLLLAIGGGSQVYRFGPKGETPKAPTLTLSVIEPQDLRAMEAAYREEAARLGVEAGADRDKKSYERSFIIRREHAGKAQAVFDAFSARLKAMGLDKKYDAKLKIPVKPGSQPYIRVRAAGADKTSGVNGVLRLLKEEGVSVEPEDVLFFGDEFDPGNDDNSMAQALPDATAIAVGRTADPRVKNVHLLPRVGPDETAAFLWDILK
jgi:hydroxymethylpyrimidine pyrophosphatase-like HAD family hydrolase